ncbi:hypothetical protein SBA2_270083 [Acidobacteriia bacterium SbA2]|nr:hypothetical protein SBA2_270083 [Acidobacteriia bacterium SbA2]
MGNSILATENPAHILYGSQARRVTTRFTSAASVAKQAAQRLDTFPRRPAALPAVVLKRRPDPLQNRR